MSPEPFDSRATALVAKRSKKGYGDENVFGFKKYTLVWAMNGHKGLSSLQLCEFMNFFCFWVQVICQCG